MQDMKQLNEMGAITDNFMDELIKEEQNAVAIGKQENFIKDKAGHFGGKGKRREKRTIKNNV